MGTGRSDISGENDACYTQKMVTPLLAVTTDELSLSDLIREVSGAGKNSVPKMGAVASFLGIVRHENLGKRVIRLEYESYEPLAIKIFEQIAAEVSDRWPVTRLAVHHRLGTLEVGEASVAIVASSPHRSESFSACRYAIERIKQIAPIWKHEFFEGGHFWIEGARADPNDDDAREEAYRRACV